jgi:hypothetical protein
LKLGFSGRDVGGGDDGAGTRAVGGEFLIEDFRLFLKRRELLFQLFYAKGCTRSIQFCTEKRREGMRKKGLVKERKNKRRESVVYFFIFCRSALS